MSTIEVIRQSTSSADISEKPPKTSATIGPATLVFLSLVHAYTRNDATMTGMAVGCLLLAL
jgi:hypothetical protein